MCPHANSTRPEGLALVTIGNSLKGDDGIAQAVCDVIKDASLTNVCRFDLGTFSGYLSDCLKHHKAAIIVDATRNGTAPGTISIIDLGALLDRVTPLNLQSCHGFSLADELRLAKRSGTLPKRMVFFGIEVSDVEFGEKVTPELERLLPKLAKKLSLLASKMVETINLNPQEMRERLEPTEP